jgi:hypothetical protein
MTNILLGESQISRVMVGQEDFLGLSLRMAHVALD